MTTFIAGSIGVDFDLLDLGPLATGSPVGTTPTSGGLNVGSVSTSLFGSGFVFGALGPPTAGTLNRIVVNADGLQVYDITDLSIPAATFRGWVVAGDNASAKAGIFGGSDSLAGSPLDDRLRGFDGADSIAGGAGADFLDGGSGNDSITAGAGNDTIVDPDGTNYLRGDEGDDFCIGGVGFDDINGNMGNDTARGGDFDDWVVGGKDNDSLSGEAGGDLVYGNLGDDTCDGGDGNDVLRGGQDNDVVRGGAGADYVSGDRGDDTVSGGLGADLFHSFGDAGIDRVLDFSAAEGDRVLLDPGTTFTTAQAGADTVASLTGGAQVVLVGVQLSTLPAGWIFVS